MTLFIGYISYNFVLLYVDKLQSTMSVKERGYGRSIKIIWVLAPGLLRGRAEAGGPAQIKKPHESLQTTKGLLPFCEEELKSI